MNFHSRQIHFARHRVPTVGAPRSFFSSLQYLLVVGGKGKPQTLPQLPQVCREGMSSEAGNEVESEPRLPAWKEGTVLQPWVIPRHLIEQMAREESQILPSAVEVWRPDVEIEARPQVLPQQPNRVPLTIPPLRDVCIRDRGGIA